MSSVQTNSPGVATILVEGLKDGTITLDEQGPAHGVQETAMVSHVDLKTAVLYVGWPPLSTTVLKLSTRNRN
jgi:hypothetical protein